MYIENLTSFINKSYQFAIYNFEFLELIITNLVEKSCMLPESIPKFHCQNSSQVILMFYFYIYAFIASCIYIYIILCVKQIQFFCNFSNIIQAITYMSFATYFLLKIKFLRFLYVDIRQFQFTHSDFKYLILSMPLCLSMINITAVFSIFLNKAAVNILEHIHLCL